MTAVTPLPTGMTLRDWFAGQVMATLIPIYAANEFTTESHDNARVAERAYLLADKMLAARKGKGK